MTTAQSIKLDLDIDRRRRPRAVINSPIQYKLVKDKEYTQGTLIDLSQTGALIEIDKPLFVKTQLSLIVNKNDEPVEIIVEVSRIAETYNEDQYIYGCVIIETMNL